MPQYAVPTSPQTLLDSGTLNTSSGTVANSYQLLDEAPTANDSDYVYGANGSTDVFRVYLTTPTNPTQRVGWILRFRAAQADEDGSIPSSGGANPTFAVELRNTSGTPVINTGTIQANEGSYQDYAFELTPSQADSAIQYINQLMVQVTINGTGGNPNNRRTIAVSQIYLEVPDVPPTPGTVPTANLIGYWPLNGDLADAVGSNNVEEIGSGTGAYNTGHFNQAWESTSAQDVRLQIPDADIFSFGDGSSDSGFSLHALLRIDSTAFADLFYKAPEYRVSTMWGTSPHQFYVIDDVLTNRLEAVHSSEDIGIDQLTWHHIMVTYNGGGTSTGVLKMYVDGILVLEGATEVGTYVAMSNTSGPVRVGDASSTRAYFLQCIGVWDKELSYAEVRGVWDTEKTNTTYLVSPSGNTLISGTVAGSATVSGDLSVKSVTKQITGSVAGSSTVAGSISVKQTIQISGAVSGSATTSGDLSVASVTKNLTGAITGTGALSGDLSIASVTKNLTGAISGTATVAGDLMAKQRIEISGSIAGTSTVTGDLSIQANVVQITGSVAGSASVSGDLSIAQVTKSISGDAAGLASVAGDLSVASITKQLTGSITGTGTLDGDLLVKSVTKSVAGDAAGSSTVAGDLSIASVTKQLTGTVAGTSTVSGNLSVQSNNQLISGTVAGTSTVSGDLSIKSVTKSISGSISGTSAVAADLSIASVLKQITGAVAGAATLSGDLSQASSNVQIAGAISGQATVSGDLSIKSVTKSIAGSVAGTSTLAGDLSIQSNNVQITGSAAGVATVAGDLSIASVTKQISGSVSGSTSLAGDLEPRSTVQLTGAATGSSTLSGDISIAQVTKQLTGAVSGVSVLSGDLSVSLFKIFLSGTAAGSSVVAGDLSPAASTKLISGSIQGTALVQGDLSVQGVQDADIIGVKPSQLSGLLVAANRVPPAVQGSKSVINNITGSK